MSSILEALKKAEQEAGTVRGDTPPWPVGVRRSPVDRKIGYGWWVAVSAVVAVVVAGVMLWKIWPVSNPPIAATSLKPSATADPRPAVGTNPPDPVDLNTATPSVAPPSTNTGAPAPPVASSDAVRGDGRGDPANAVPVLPPVANNPWRTETRPAAPGVTTPLPEIATSPKVPSNVEPVDARPDLPVQRSAAATETVRARPPRSEPAKPEKNFRNDARIELQALVWAPEASERFVVINDHLVKEGGAVDGITVVRINREDILLSEGADRWHQKFTIR